jgi:hypothetical protein
MNLRPWIILFLVCPLLRAQDDLPRRAPGNSLDFEPKLMLEGPTSATPAPPVSPVQSPQDRVRQCEAACLLAQQRAADAEQLFKEGILAKVEVEARFLRIVQVQKDLAAARLAVAAANAESIRKSFAAHQSTQADVDTANAALKTASDAAAAASIAWDQAQLKAAETDLQRKRKLLSEGVGSRHEVELAADRVALLSGTASH